MRKANKNPRCEGLISDPSESPNRLQLGVSFFFLRIHPPFFMLSKGTYQDTHPFSHGRKGKHQTKKTKSGRGILGGHLPVAPVLASAASRALAASDLASAAWPSIAVESSRRRLESARADSWRESRSSSPASAFFPEDIESSRNRTKVELPWWKRKVCLGLFGGPATQEVSLRNQG